MKILLKISVLAMFLFPNTMINQSLGAGDPPQTTKKNNTGSSIENPIVLKGIKKAGDIKEALNEYISNHYKGYIIAGYMYTMEKDRFIEIVDIENEEKSQKLIYFDLTDIYKKLKNSRDKKTREKTKELIEQHLPLKDLEPSK